MSRVEDLLRRAQPPAEPPTRYRELAADAALGGGSSNAGGQAARRAWWRRPQTALVGALAVVAVTVIALVAVGTGGGGGGGGGHGTTIALQGKASFAAASGTLQLANSSSDAMRNAVLQVKDLPPAPPGSYYEMWMASGNEDVGIMAFDTNADGTVTVRSAIPANMPWTRCWVSLEHESGAGSTSQPVLGSTA